MLRRRFVAAGCVLGSQIALQVSVRLERHDLSELPDLVRVAHRVAWRISPVELLNDPVQFIAHVMTFGEIEDVAITRAHFNRAEFRRVSEAAPSGVFDPRSWNYWHVVLNGRRAPAMHGCWFGFKRIRKVGHRLATAAEIKCEGIPCFPRSEEIIS